MDEDTRRRLAEIRDLWNKTESRAKLAEQFREEAIVAAINEMRYAGRRIVDILADLEQNGWEETTDVRDNLVVAKNYLINADHDVTDAVCFFAHRRFSRIVDVHGLRKVSRHCAEFDELYPDILIAQETIRVSRENRRDRDAAYERLATEYVPRVIALFEKVRGIPELSIPENLPAQISLLQRYVVVVAWVAFAGSFASIVALGWMIVDYFST